jgi:predicted TIM-barrel fold metal-dependent hydrolase
MILDMHAHTVAPPELYAFKAILLSGRGYHGRGALSISDDRIEQFAKQNIDTMNSVGTDMQFLSPRPFQLMHSEKPASIVRYWCEANNDVIAKQVKNHPDRFAGVCGLPQVSGEPDTKHVLGELERCVKDLGFIGCMINPDPGEGTEYTPPLDDEYWYPLYEKMVELNVPALIHSAACKDQRESYSAHFITTESQVVLNLLKVESKVFKDFPDLRIIVAHGGGSVPYQIGRWRAHRFNEMKANPNLEDFDASLRRLYYDAVLYNKESLELLFRLVGTDRCMFGTEKPGSGSAVDPATGKWLDDTRPVIESIEWLTDQDKKNIFEENQKRVFPRLKVPAAK